MIGIKLKLESKDLNISTSFCVLTIYCLLTKGTEKQVSGTSKIKNFVGDKMPTLTLSIPRELKERMDKHPEINWPEVLRRRLEKRAEQLLKFEEMVKRGEI